MADQLSPHPWPALDRHLDDVRACRRCPNVEPPPVAARPAAWPHIVLVGQAPGPREVVEQRPFAWTAGTRLFSWFERLGVTEDEFRRRVFLCAVIRCFPGRAPQGGDRVPAGEDRRARRIWTTSCASSGPGWCSRWDSSPSPGSSPSRPYSLISSAKRHGLEPYAYLRDLFLRLPSHPAERIAEFTPAALAASAAR